MGLSPSHTDQRAAAENGGLDLVNVTGIGTVKSAAGVTGLEVVNGNTGKEVVTEKETVITNQIVTAVSVTVIGRGNIDVIKIFLRCKGLESGVIAVSSCKGSNP